MSGPVCDTGQPFYWLLQQSRLPIIAPMDENNKKPQRDIYTCFYKHLWFSLLVYILFPIYTELCTHIYGGQRLTSVSSLIALHQGIVPLSLSLPKLVDSASQMAIIPCRFPISVSWVLGYRWPPYQATSTWMGTGHANFGSHIFATSTLPFWATPPFKKMEIASYQAPAEWFVVRTRLA